MEFLKRMKLVIMDFGHFMDMDAKMIVMENLLDGPAMKFDNCMPNLMQLRFQTVTLLVEME